MEVKFICSKISWLPYAKDRFFKLQLRCGSVGDNGDGKRRLRAAGASNGWWLFGHMGAAVVPLGYDAHAEGYHILGRKSWVFLRVTWWLTDRCKTLERTESAKRWQIMEMFIQEKAWEKVKRYGRLHANTNWILKEKRCLPSWRKRRYGYIGVSCEHHPQEFHPSQDAGASWCLKEVFVKAV